ncbi:hypothetical protein EXIGLDRAFT_701132 [Exidia glandulosa HHB12029]|uniref:Uncharacterized protein n=1 Tax=Exidia glandulosa HHB12029 TaxID=1314781 RepID=A0A165D3C5_EXIGL|nr:hypothetical protein EXIGLDRAFT_701132 [Exidia glandulosa HHB12029]
MAGSQSPPNHFTVAMATPTSRSHFPAPSATRSRRAALTEDRPSQMRRARKTAPRQTSWILRAPPSFVSSFMYVQPNRTPGCSSFARTVNAAAAHGTFRQRETSQLVVPSVTTKGSPLGRCIQHNSQEEPQHSASPHASDSDAPSTAHVSSYGRTRKRCQRKRR